MVGEASNKYSAVYQRVTYGQCSRYISSAAECAQAAAVLLGREAVVRNETQKRVSPTGCYNSRARGVRMNMDGTSTGKCSLSLICFCKVIKTMVDIGWITVSGMKVVRNQMVGMI